MGGGFSIGLGVREPVRGGERVLDVGHPPGGVDDQVRVVIEAQERRDHRQPVERSVEEQLAAGHHLVADQQVEVPEARREQQPGERLVERIPVVPVQRVSVPMEPSLSLSPVG